MWETQWQLSASRVVEKSQRKGARLASLVSFVRDVLASSLRDAFVAAALAPAESRRMAGVFGVVRKALGKALAEGDAHLQSVSVDVLSGLVADDSRERSVRPVGWSDPVLVSLLALVADGDDAGVMPNKARVVLQWLVVRVTSQMERNQALQVALRCPTAPHLSHFLPTWGQFALTWSLEPQQ